MSKPASTSESHLGHCQDGTRNTLAGFSNSRITLRAASTLSRDTQMAGPMEMPSGRSPAAAPRFSPTTRHSMSAAISADSTIRTLGSSLATYTSMMLSESSMWFILQRSTLVELPSQLSATKLSSPLCSIALSAASLPNPYDPTGRPGFAVLRRVNQKRWCDCWDSVDNQVIGTEWIRNRRGSTSACKNVQLPVASWNNGRIDRLSRTAVS